SRGAVGTEVAERQDRDGQRARDLVVGYCGFPPVVNGWERLAAVTRIGRRFVPADARHGIVGAPLGEIAELPRRGSGATGGVDEQVHRVVERQRLAVLFQVQPVPIAAAPVAAGVPALLVRSVR